MLAIKGYRAALNHTFVLVGLGLAANRVINRVLSTFEKSCLLKEIKLPEWNLSGF